MRSSWATLVGAAVVLIAFVGESQKGAAYEVRYLWMDIVPAFFLSLAVLGRFIVSRTNSPAGPALTWAAAGGLLTQAFLIVIVPLQRGDLPFARVWPVLEIFAILGFIALMNMPSPQQRSRTLVFVGVALAARGVARVVTDPLLLRFVGTALELAAIVVALRAMTPPRSTPRVPEAK